MCGGADPAMSGKWALSTGGPADLQGFLREDADTAVA
jgi:hypothetical protein